LESKRRAGALERELRRWQGFEFCFAEINTSREKEIVLHASLDRRYTGQQYISRPYLVLGGINEAVLLYQAFLKGVSSLESGCLCWWLNIGVFSL